MTLARRSPLLLAGMSVAVTALLAPTAANADPAPGCTAADLANIAASVAAQTSGYLYAHPDLNAFYTDLHNKPQDEVPDDVRAYFDANPQAHTDLLGIRQPLNDFRARCGVTQPSQPLLGD